MMHSKTEHPVYDSRYPGLKVTHDSVISTHNKTIKRDVDIVVYSILQMASDNCSKAII